MDSETPLVSIGLPVHNGENYMEDAIESVLRQTYRNIELIISDNASTDSTQSICRRYASIDKRIRYVRLTRNMGAMVNHNNVLGVAQGKYFQWVCHDDKCEHAYIQRCVEILEGDDRVACCFSVIKSIDENDHVLRLGKDDLSILDDNGLDRIRRFIDLQKISVDIFCAMYGLFRTESIRRVGQVGTYIAGDQVFLLKMIYEGKLYQLSNPLVCRREHMATAFVALPKLPYYKRYKDATRWGDTSRNPVIVLVNWKLMRESFAYFFSYPKSDKEKLRVSVALLKMFGARWKRLIRELLTIPGQIVFHLFEGKFSGRVEHAP